MKFSKYVVLLIILLYHSSWLSAQVQDTVHVIPFNGETIVTNPAKGSNYYYRWGKFPAIKENIRSIKLHVKFECPDSMRCADWDYVDYIKIKRVGGVKGFDKDFEIARMLTPYGGAFKKDWNFAWEVDITDFSLLLRDSVEFEYNHTGYEPNKDRGWKVTLDFEIIKGKPVAVPVSIQKIYSQSFKYGDSTTSIEEDLQPVSFQKKSEADFAKFRILQTGHGANQGDHCGEFCSKKRMIVYNGQLIDTRPIWKTCGDNPLYPQAGTWIYDRANWCPGYLQIPDEYLLPLQLENTIDVNMEPYRVNKTQAVENITAYIIQYKKVAATTDVAITDIKKPTDKLVYARLNPAVFKPTIIIKNNGTKTLKSLKIVYSTKGFSTNTYNWRGQLVYGTSEEIELPGHINAMPGENYFTVSLVNPNNKKDAFLNDNTMSARFTAAPVHAEKLIFVLRTNNQPEQNSYTITDTHNKKIFFRTFDSTQKNQLFEDTLLLPQGRYNFFVTDSGGDGLEFWANKKGGRGFVRIQDMAGNLVKDFISDFGNTVNYDFSTTTDSSAISRLNNDVSINLYPTSTSGATTLDYFSGKAEDVVVQIITDEGAQLVEQHLYKNLKEGSFTYDMSYREPQRYYIKVLINNQLIFIKRLRIQ
ncbi:MAG: peptide-N-glycosidase F-related protein [Niabella sp.]